MNRDDIIRMADEACGGKPPNGWGVMFDHDQLERFVALVEAHGAAAERQRCVTFLMNCHMQAGGKHNYYHVAANQLLAQNETDTA